MEQRGIIRSTGLIGMLTGVSRLLGLARDMLMAGMFGTSMAMSAFVVAFRLPNLFRALFGEGALSAAFIPVFVETRAQGDARAWKLAREVFTLLALVLLVLVAVGMAALTWALRAPDLAPRVDLTLRLARIMLPYLWFICVAAGFMGILNAYHRFAVPAAAPWLLNLCIIAAVLWVAPRFGAAPEVRIYAVCWAVLVAGALQAGIQWPSLHRLGFRLRPAWGWRSPGLRRVLTLMGPAALGRAVTQVNVTVDSLLALGIGAWAPAALYFSERLIQLPIGLFATALATVLLPVLSAHAARNDRPALLRTAADALRMLWFVMTPAAFALLALSEPVVGWAFRWGDFSSDSVVLSARALRFYVPVLLVYPLAKVLVPAFHAMQDTRTPLRVGLVSVALNVVLSVGFMLSWPPDYKHAGIALATVLAAAVNGAGLAWRLRRIGPLGWGGLGRSALRMLAGGAIMGFVAGWVHGALGVRFPAIATGKGAQLAALALAVAAGMGAYLGVVRLLGGGNRGNFGARSGAAVCRGGRAQPSPVLACEVCTSATSLARAAPLSTEAAAAR